MNGSGASRKKRVLAVASGGGHWRQLRRLQPAWSGARVTYATTIAAYRDEIENGAAFAVVPDASRWNKAMLLWQATRVLLLVLRSRPQVIVTTGAAPGFWAVVFGRLLGARTCWIDSVANAEELSGSGERVGRFARLWVTQWEHLARPPKLRFFGNVLGKIPDREAREVTPPGEVRVPETVLVTVGTQLPFDRLLGAIDQWAQRHPDARVFAQIGPSGVSPEHVETSVFLEPRELDRRIREADVVVAHAGVGTVLSCLMAGTPVVLMPRLASRREHRNEHQSATADRFRSIPGVVVADDESRLEDAIREAMEHGGGRLGEAADDGLIRAISEFVSGGSPT
ncbi:MAG: glycosyltransferase [Planctomycetota bacterium]